MKKDILMQELDIQTWFMDEQVFLDGADIRGQFMCREKIKGVSITCLLQKRKRLPWQYKAKTAFTIHVNNNYDDDADSNPLFARIAEEFCIEDMLKSTIGMGDWIAVQGIIVGPGIEGNPYCLDAVDFYAFNLLRQSEDPTISISYTMPCTVGEMIMRANGIKWVPSVGVIDLPMPLEKLKQYAAAPSRLNKAINREGIICRNFSQHLHFMVPSNKAGYAIEVS